MRYSTRQAMPASAAILGSCMALSAIALLGFSTSATAQTHSGCYVEDDSGQLYDLSILCETSNSELASPVLQTGDVQVTLRWDTSDDLDLVVVDPAGEQVSYLNPTVSSGGQLDVDANAFCETASAAPVENIFWPTGGAPAGQYSAYVVLSIPCSGAAITAVDYSLTILNQGQRETYEGVARLDSVQEDGYAFALE
ncbi:MAG: hypothetical protein F6J97_09060 [Leptolyngbya sp. SIO4C1]|nr:hypothetical protein [Leptolyngbya sp. SIO4C1]